MDEIDAEVNAVHAHGRAQIMGGDADINVFWTKLHTIDGSGFTVPARFEDVIAAGAAGYAALEWASFSTNRVNVGGRDVWRE